MSVIRYEFVKLAVGFDRKGSNEFFIDDVIAAGEITATTTETVAGARITVPSGAGYVVLSGISGGHTLVGTGSPPDAAAKGKMVREGSDVIIIVKTGEQLSFKARA